MEEKRWAARGCRVSYCQCPVSWKQLIRQEMPTPEDDSSEEDIWDQYVGARV